MMKRPVLAIFCGALSACAARVAPPRELSPGDATGAPSAEALPSLDVDEGSFTREMRMARLLSEESFQVPDPEPPTSRQASALSAWGEQTLAPWLSRKHRSVEAARQELDRAAAQDQRQRIVAGALVGLMYEDVARVLLEVPAPLELESEPEVKAMHRELTAEQAEAYLVQARLAYNACAGNAQAIETMRHWTAFCRARFERLPATPEQPASGEQPVSGETSVTVERE